MLRFIEYVAQQPWIQTLCLFSKWELPLGFNLDRGQGHEGWLLCVSSLKTLGCAESHWEHSFADCSSWDLAWGWRKETVVCLALRAHCASPFWKSSVKAVRVPQLDHIHTQEKLEEWTIKKQSCLSVPVVYRKRCSLEHISLNMFLCSLTISHMCIVYLGHFHPHYHCSCQSWWISSSEFKQVPLLPSGLFSFVAFAWAFWRGDFIGAGATSWELHPLRK